MPLDHDLLYRRFRNGLNLGGWLSQFEIDLPGPLTPAERRDHFSQFITRSDMARISDWGFDHIRLCIDGRPLTEAGPGQPLNADFLSVIDRCLDWCDQFKLNAILDLHDFHGHEWGKMDQLVPLLSDPAIADHFIATWEKLARHVLDRHEQTIMLELLNEVSDASGTRWNNLVSETIKAVRRIDPERWILVGSNGQNGVNYLHQLRLPDDPRVFATFHYYEPQAFTHQRAHFSPEHKEFNKALSYPGDLDEFGAFISTKPEYRIKHELARGESRNDRNLMERLLSPAAAFTETTGVGLYCGEFGVIDSANLADAARWVEDFVNWAERHRVGRALWTYKDRDFGLVRADGSLRAGLVLKALSK
ncbi:MAG: glycoside hydrolase family 5 protein [Bifidobacteriaceae bacterium]|jgi:hypothetical protein|nr:glycoside hydrolase family 5 protein [Bifidobacteriaceae bacterium]